jgi:hypothetical protein
VRTLKPIVVLAAFLASLYVVSWGIEGAPPGFRHDMVVSFGSVCCGPDEEVMGRLNGLIALYGRSHPGGLRIEHQSWGLEGEYDYCIDFLGLIWAERREFREAVRSIVKASTRHTVELKAGGICGWSR